MYRTERLKTLSSLAVVLGNHIGIEHLVEGMNIDDVIEKLKGVTCGSKKLILSGPACLRP